MVKLVGVKKGGGPEAMLILGVTAQDFANGLAGQSLVFEPAELGLPWLGSIVVMMGTTSEQIVARATGDGAQLLPMDTPEAAKKRVEDAIYGKTKN